MALASIFESSEGEQRWISQVSKILQNDEVMVEIDLPVSIFRVPTTISAFKPEAYTPQLMGLGPYHHFRSELYEMERYKLAAASRLQKQFKSLEFKQLVEKLAKFEHKVRACYHKYLDVECDTLAWIMAIDGLFLLDFLQNYLTHVKENISSTSTTAHLVDSSGRKLAHGSILGDIMMLENQIPIFVLRAILSIQCSLPDVEDNLLPTMLMGFCKALSPLKLVKEDLPLSQVSEHAHLLDLLYHLTVPKLENSQEHQGKNTCGKFESSSSHAAEKFDSSKSCHVFDKLWSLLSNLNVGFVSKITKPIQNILGVSSKIVSSVPGISFLSSKKKEDIKPEDEASSDEKKTPKVEEIMIPSVSMLRFAGVEFCSSNGGLATIKFNKYTKKFHLPVIILNVNSEVVMRNLVAYEASTASESLPSAGPQPLFKHLLRKSFASSENHLGNSGTSPEHPIRSRAETGSFTSGHGGDPVAISITVQPRTQISAENPCSSPETTSDAMNTEYLTIDERRALEGEIVRKCLARTEKQCSFVEHRNYKIVYRRYASLFFLVGVDNEENELSILEFIHLLVETMDRHSGNMCNMCELDIMFHLEKAHFMLEEMVMNGCIVETSKANILSPPTPSP
ncbi:hypothetical protein TEA_027141 [Camellia sinensis var. sinensis]|uniref:AP complex mu/sigma subunit domain-containing protein n=2 Tax=Camellia sinensis TaxID=4442 RepID=A0A4S4EG58_CAMSN|nr:hypothetical protein TEA_027141 [Camellia sinensis var. sinensis]